MLILFFGCLLATGNLPIIELQLTKKSFESDESLQIETTNGSIQGSKEKTINNMTFYKFVGVPYAKPPIYQLRFKNPQPLSNWSGIVNATVPASCCAGIDLGNFDIDQLLSSGSEDCLYLNLYTTKKPKSEIKNKLAVMVYFHGGAFVGGCGNNLNPDFFMEENVVLVIPNYRLSIFGYLSTEDLESPGNYALKDGIAVLKWVQLNIHKFGGDPNRVTIFGQSSGAANVNALLLSQNAKSLFHNVILMSGTSLAFWSIQLEARNIAFNVGLAVGIETNNSEYLIRTLRKLDRNMLKQSELSVFLLNAARFLTHGIPLAINIEPNHKDAILTKYPLEILQDGSFNKVPVMIGVMKKEAIFYDRIIKMLRPFLGIFNLSPSSIIRFTNNLKHRRIVALKIFNYFFNTTDITQAKDKDLKEFVSEEAYRRPAMKEATLISRHCPVYFFEFTYQGKIGLDFIRRFLGKSFKRNPNYSGATHMEDIPYLFNIGDMKNNKGEVEFAKKLTRVYTNFAKTSNPTPTRDPFLDNATWPRIIPGKFPYLNLGRHFSQVSNNYNDENFQFWENLYNKYGEKPFKVF
ncbi:hypothetical protein ABEB36_008946 [Hypothenemus hampei]|uniref:Carboxylic ester hydrolase n=1 Tax=Hypothenemus hampei TaxID=57062 RepID=A0ABD1ENP3_HYPHA